MKFSLRFGLLIVIVTVFAFGSGHAQSISMLEQNRFEAYNFEFNGNGARAMGMGNAFLGVSDDVTGIGWNPAGLYLHDAPVFGFSYTSLSPRGSSSSDRMDITGLLSNLSRVSYDHEGSFGGLSSGNFVAPVRLKGHPFVGSISYTRNSNEYQFQGFQLELIEVFPIFNEVGTLIEQDTVLESVEVLSELQGGIDALNIGFGTRLYGNLAFGASINVFAGKVQRVTNVLVSGDNIPVNNFQNGFLTVVGKTIDSNTFSGFNFNVGMKLDGEKLDVGAIVRTPFTLSQKGENFSSQIVSVNGSPISTDTTFLIDLLTKYEIPLMVGLGFGYQINDKWLVAADAEYRHFSTKEIKIRESVTLVPGADNVEEFVVLSEDEWQWSDVFIVRTGTEYLYQTGIGTIPFRTGFGYVPVPAPDVDVNGNRSTAVSYELSFGTGIHWSQIHLDIGYKYSTLDLESMEFATTVNNQNHFVTASFSGVF